MVAVNVNTIPSMNNPFTDKSGRISPVWYEFLRSFVAATVDGTINENDTTSTVTAGAGLTGGGVGDTTLNVGAGSGIAVNADDVSVDIINQENVQAALDDYVLVSDTDDNNNIKKTKVRNIIELSAPGGSNTNVQYNDNGIFGANSNFVTDGNGAVDIIGDLDIDNININGNTLSTTNTNGDFTLDPNGTGRVICNTQIGNSAGSATARCLSLSGNSVRIYGTSSSSYIDMTGTSGPQLVAGTKSISVGTTNTNIQTDVTLTTGYLSRFTVASITASTTQTQGQGALTGDINEISTCANANDTVTLPVALAGRSCLVINNGAQTLQVFPASGDDLGAGVNTATTIVAGSRKWFVAFDSTNWEPVL